jgi:hypothetical protein
MLPIAETRLSRSEPQYSEPAPPELWENRQPPGRRAPEPAVARSPGGLVVSYPAPTTNCPLLVSTDPGSDYALTSVETGVLFDIDADGHRDRTAWTEPGTDVAFLALDRNDDGRISSGHELISDRSVPSVTTGVRALSQLSVHSGTRGAIDVDDPLFGRLLLWRDANHNGNSEPEELRAAADELSAIGLGYQRHRRIDPHGNQSRFRGFVHLRTEPGKNPATTPGRDPARHRYMYDVCLVVR